MGSEERTLKLVMNLDRAAIEAKLEMVRNAAEAKNLTDLAALFQGIQGMPHAQIEQRVKSALKWLMGKSEHNQILAQLELVEINLPNLK
ncbi:MAG: hypothetical protein OEW21_02220 [Betaproteobacteria bacterium]|nr:hypothetical protein [Betaproteobacteria bacterium]